MKRIAVVALALVAIASTLRAQLTLAPDDLTHLIAIAEISSKNPNPEGDDFKAMEAHRTPALNHVVDVMLSVSHRDTSLLSTRVLGRPSNDELVMWYVIRQINHNNVGKESKHLPAEDVAKATLAAKTDTRILLDSYYHQIHGGIAFLFNDADLSSFNVDIETLGLKDETEKGIFYLNFTDALIGARLRVLSMMKNNEGIIKFCSKMPYINRKPYYFFKGFSYKDFEFENGDKTEMFNEYHLGILYNVLFIHWNAAIELKGSSAAKDIFRNSILSTPEYFKYSGVESELKKLYNKQK